MAGLPNWAGCITRAGQEGRRREDVVDPIVSYGRLSVHTQAVLPALFKAAEKEIPGSSASPGYTEGRPDTLA